MEERERVIGEYKVGKQIGSGSFSVVWHALHRIHGTEVAIKEIDMSRLNKKLQHSLFSEIFILKRIIHPNIIRLLDIVEVPGKIHLVLEYCRGGDLFMHTQRHGSVSEATAKDFMIQLAAGLKILRENNLIHRDLKPQNLLLSTNDNNSVLKIADFGFARSLQPRGLAETLCGSPLYMAPEIMQLQKYDAKADLWSVGTILYQLITGKTPFIGSNQIQLLQNIIKATELCFPPDLKDLSAECVDLCQKLLRSNPVERLTFEEFFNHPFLCQYQQNETSRGTTTLRMEDSHPSLDDPIDNRNESCSDDWLPFLLDDDSSGLDGSPYFLGRKTSMKSSYGSFPDPRKEPASDPVKYMDNFSRQMIKTSGFRIDNSRPANYDAHPLISMEQRPVSSHLRVTDLSASNDQDYVLISGPSLGSSASSIDVSKPSVYPSKPSYPIQASLGLCPRSATPVPIVRKSTRNAYYIESLERQCSDPCGNSRGSLDTSDVVEQPSNDFTTRLRSLQDCAASIKELANDMVDAGRHLDAFSIQLVVLALWKQAVHICHTQEVSSVYGSPSQDVLRFKGSTKKMSTRPDSHEGLYAINSQSQVLDDASAEIKKTFLCEVGRAEDLAKFVDPAGKEEMPDAMETIYRSALALGRHGAVDELMGEMESAASSYSKAVRLLVFLLVEAPSLILNPPFSLTNSDRCRLRNYINTLNDRQGISRSQRVDVFKPEDQA